MSGKLKIKGDVMKVGCNGSDGSKGFPLTVNFAGYEDGAYPEEGPDEGKVVDDEQWTALTRTYFWYR